MLALQAIFAMNLLDVWQSPLHTHHPPVFQIQLPVFRYRDTSATVFLLPLHRAVQYFIWHMTCILQLQSLFSSARISAVWGWSPSTTTKRMHLRLFRCDLAISSHLFHFSAIERSQLRTDIPACKPQHRCLSSASTYPAAFPGSTCATLEKPQGIPRIRFAMHSPISTSTRPYCIMQAILSETLQAISMLPHLAHISTRQLVPPQTHPDSKPLWMICLWKWLSPSTARKLVHALSIGTKVHLSRHSGILVPFARKLHRFLRSLMRNCTVPGGAIAATSASTHGGFLESPCWRVPPVSFFCSKSGYFAFTCNQLICPGFLRASVDYTIIATSKKAMATSTRQLWLVRGFLFHLATLTCDPTTAKELKNNYLQSFALWPPGTAEAVHKTSKSCDGSVAFQLILHNTISHRLQPAVFPATAGHSLAPLPHSCMFLMLFAKLGVFLVWLSLMFVLCFIFSSHIFTRRWEERKMSNSPRGIHSSVKQEGIATARLSAERRWQWLLSPWNFESRALRLCWIALKKIRERWKTVMKFCRNLANLGTMGSSAIVHLKQRAGSGRNARQSSTISLAAGKMLLPCERFPFLHEVRDFKLPATGFSMTSALFRTSCISSMR